MNTAESQLSSELQELYLESKEKLSDILFLEDESRFFPKLFEKALLSTTKEEKFRELEFVNSRMVELQERLVKLNVLLSAQQHSIENILRDTGKNIEMSLLDQDIAICSEIKALLILDRSVKKELYAHVEHFRGDQKSGNTLDTR
ncbi:MAG: hypothetical protein WBJ10_05515 [Daejeonella sp.]|uniref:hypothetical protein n=1 Tax=Daejeonella sp. TaxID=2805397 RepID=UPI003C720788